MFQDPVPYGLWPTDLDGTNFGQHCPQFDRITGQTIGNEDCLFLNIFTPFISVSGKLRQFLRSTKNRAQARVRARVKATKSRALLKG